MSSQVRFCPVQLFRRVQLFFALSNFSEVALSWMCTTGIIRAGKKMLRISHHCSSKESRGGNAAGGKSKRGNYKPGAAIVGKETFLGRL